jgi:hypothetical protein
MAKETAPETMARLQPSSEEIGLKKTPNETYIPGSRIHTTSPAPTITQP